MGRLMMMRPNVALQIMFSSSSLSPSLRTSCVSGTCAAAEEA